MSEIHYAQFESGSDVVVERFTESADTRITEDSNNRITETNISNTAESSLVAKATKIPFTEEQFYNDESTWKQILNIYVKYNGLWVEPYIIYKTINGVWKRVK